MAVVRGFVAASVGGLLCAIPLGAQQVTTGTITGRVVDSTSQQPLANVTVAVPGTQRGALTAADGRFTITAVPAGPQRVRAQRIGYASRDQQVTVTAGSPVTVTFSLAASASALTEVVVVGYGAQRREAITGAVAQVKADEANVGVVTNANQLLNARVPGVQVTSNSGDPGGGLQIRVRGGTSISASNEPLYVIDGVPLQQDQSVAPPGIGISGNTPALPRSPLNTINPNDIASITVLKDASATAIYGSRGANGVILIETKKGAAGNTQIEYEGYVAAATPARTLDVLSGGEYRDFVAQGTARFQAARTARDSAFALNPTSAPTLGNANTDWADEVLRTAPTTNHNVALSGGSQSTQYRAALNYFNQQGVLLNNGLQRYQGRINAQSEALQNKLRFQLNLTSSRVNNRYPLIDNRGGFEGGVLTNVAIFNPTQPVRTDGGAYYEVGAGSQSVRNPVAMSYQLNDRSAENRTLGNANVSYTLLPTLVGQMNIGIDQSGSTRQVYWPLSSPVGAPTGGRALQAQQNLLNINYQGLLTFTPRISGSQELEVVGGYEFTQFDNSGLRADVRGFVSDRNAFENLAGGAQAQSLPDSSGRTQSRLVSFFGRANYGFRNKYFLTGVLRYDGSTRLAPGNQWSLFPAVSASYRLSEEGFMKNTPFSTLSIRAGYGLQGNQAVRPYATQVLVRTDPNARYQFGGPLTGLSTGFVATSNLNTDLKWEISAQANVGFDYGFAQNRFSGTVDLYQKNTRDLLLEVAVPQPAFVATRFENIGSLRNRGFEASLNADVFTRPASSLTTGLVFTLERNQVTDLGGRPFIQTGNISGQGQSGQFAQRIVKGQPLGTFYGPEFAGIDEVGRQLFNQYDSTGTRVVGTTTTPGGNDIRVIGNSNPDFTVGFTSRATFRRFDASWLWRADVGRDVFNNTALVYSSKANVAQGRNFLASALDDGTATLEPAKYSSRWIENGTFARLQNVTVGYNFRLPGFAGRGAATRVYLSGDNLLLFTPYNGVDPEVFVEAGVASRGIDYLTYPRARTFTLGTRLQF